MKGLDKELSKEHFEIIQTEDAYQFYSYTAAKHSVKEKIPLVLRHDLSSAPRFPYNLAFSVVERTISKKIVATAKIGIVPTRAAYGYLRNLNSDFALTLIPFGVDTEQFKPGTHVENQKPPIPLPFRKENSFLILTIARLIKTKGVIDLVYALKKIRAEIPSVRLILIGKGPLKSKILQIAKTLNVDDVITFLDFVRHDTIQYYYNLCDIFLLPSYEEAPGLTIMEAMACEKPVVATNISGINDVINNGVDGMLFDPGDRDAICNLIRDLYFSPDLRTAIARNARTKILASYSWDIVCSRMMKIYEQLGS